MPSGAKKRKAAKKKQEQASSTQINLKSNNHDSRSQGEKESHVGFSSHENYKKAGFTEEDVIRVQKEPELDTDEHIEITDSSHDHDKSSSSSSSSRSSSSSDDESGEVKKRNDNKETRDSVSEVITASSVPIAGDAPFMGSTANVIVENTALMDLVMPNDTKTGEHIEISHVDTIISKESDKKSLPKPTEITAEVPLASDDVMQTSSGANDSDLKENAGNTSSLPEDSRESEVVITHEEEALLIPTHGIAQRTSWFSCCGLFDVVTGSSR